MGNISFRRPHVQSKLKKNEFGGWKLAVSVSPNKIKHVHTLRPRKSMFGYIPWRNSLTWLDRKMYRDFHCGAVSNSQTTCQTENEYINCGLSLVWNNVHQYIILGVPGWLSRKSMGLLILES